MIRYFPPKATAGLATFAVRTPSLLPRALLSSLSFSFCHPFSAYDCIHYNILLTFSEHFLQIFGELCKLFIKKSQIAYVKQPFSRIYMYIVYEQKTKRMTSFIKILSFKILTW